MAIHAAKPQLLPTQQSSKSSKLKDDYRKLLKSAELKASDDSAGYLDHSDLDDYNLEGGESISSLHCAKESLVWNLVPSETSQWTWHVTSATLSK
ncbi:hypothetical protein EKO04_008080 [Ascochyta lentis]|uniref:Uncharacterized protein n=1 Tax=Ascochyta lentis TaxID=205686 RepID=A0A8H7IXD1_9PLEO|nr:hypothetical protein EKO04_008080 [Ascochyta lentis]